MMGMRVSSAAVTQTDAHGLIVAHHGLEKRESSGRKWYRSFLDEIEEGARDDSIPSPKNQGPGAPS
jgi:hypothetical protein